MQVYQLHRNQLSRKTDGKSCSQWEICLNAFFLSRGDYHIEDFLVRTMKQDTNKIKPKTHTQDGL